jgi:PRC-barrel domain protein
MFEAENIRDWREHDVIDPDGKKIGQLEAVYVDTTSDEPAFCSIRIGMVGRRRLTFVPLDRAVVLPRQLRVAYSKSQVRGAPTIDTDGELPASDEPGLFKHYGLAYQAGVSGERQLARRLAVRVHGFFVGLGGDPMVLFLLLVIAAIVLGILGAVIKGLFFLVIVGPVVFILAFVVLGFWLRSHRRRTPVR